MACGITKLIKTTFAPTWKYKKLLHLPKNVGGLKKRAAKTRGNRIDAELASGQTVKTCLETRTIRDHLTSMNMQIVKCQVSVKNANLMTFIDMLVRDNTGKMFVVEVKRGAHYKKCCTQAGTLCFQRKTLSDCLLYQHQLQALIGRWLANEETNWGVMLIYVTDDTINIYRETDFEAELLQSGKDAIVKAATRKRKLRTARAMVKRRKVQAE